MAGNDFQHAGGLHLPPAVHAAPGRTTPPTSAALTKLGSERLDTAELLHMFFSPGNLGNVLFTRYTGRTFAFTSIMNTYTKTTQEIHTQANTAHENKMGRFEPARSVNTSPYRGKTTVSRC